MMVVDIHYMIGDTEDCIRLTGKDPDEIRVMADTELTKRGGKDPWSEVIEE